MSGKPPTDRDERTLGPDDERSHSVSSRQSLTSFTRPLLDVGFWPIATNFSLGPDVSFWGEAEVGRAEEFAAPVEIDPSLTLSLPSKRPHKCHLSPFRASVGSI